MRRLLKPVWIAVAVAFLFEAWLWETLRAIVARLAAALPWQEIKKRLSDAIERLPPAATLIVFVVPAILLFPIKLAGFWMLAHGHWFTAMGMLGFAKIVSMGVTAFIFDLTRPKLLQLAWFRLIYDHVLVWLDKAHALIDPIKREARMWLNLRLASARRWLRRFRRTGRAASSGRFSRRLRRLRARMRAAGDPA